LKKYDCKKYEEVGKGVIVYEKHAGNSDRISNGAMDRSNAGAAVERVKYNRILPARGNKGGPIFLLATKAEESGDKFGIAEFGVTAADSRNDCPSTSGMDASDKGIKRTKFVIDSYRE